MNQWFSGLFMVVSGGFGLMFVTEGVHKADIIEGIGLDPNWRRASPETLMIIGLGLLMMFVLLGRDFVRDWRTRRDAEPSTQEIQALARDLASVLISACDAQPAGAMSQWQARAMTVLESARLAGLTRD